MAAAAKTLENLAGPRCVASPGSRQKIRRNLKLTALLDYSAPHRFSGEMVNQGKPAPDLFLFSAQSMGVASADCVVIEDSVAGVRAAGAVAVIKCFSDLPDFLAWLIA